MRWAIEIITMQYRPYTGPGRAGVAARAEVCTRRARLLHVGLLFYSIISNIYLHIFWL